MENKIHYLMLANVKYLWAILMVAGLALAGCGGSDPAPVQIDDDDEVELTTAACVADEDYGEGYIAQGGECVKAPIDALEGLDLAAANQLTDGITNAAALAIGSRHVDAKTAKATPGTAWKERKGIVALNGWEGKGYEIRLSAGSSGQEQDLRVWTENPLHISQKYVKFFVSTNPKITGTSGEAAASTGVVTLADVSLPAFNKKAVPGDFYSAPFRFKAGQPYTVRSGTFYGVPGEFRCPASLACSQYTDSENGDAPVDADNPNSGAIGTAAISTITFHPSNFNAEATIVPALFAENPNPDFLHFGLYWNTVINDKDEVTAITVDPFAGGQVPYTAIAGIVQSGTGVVTAKYMGEAAGSYVLTRKDANDDDEAIGYGGFSADAEFTAKFAVSEDTLTGKIDNFRRFDNERNAGEKPPASWSVPLEGKIDGDNGSVGNDDNSFFAQFYGGESDKRNNQGHGDAPYGLVGTFEHGFDDGQVVGAFGAECRGGNCIKNN